MSKNKNKFKECLENNKGVCSLNCNDYKNGACPGYYSTVTDSNNNKLFSIPLFNEYKEGYFKELEMEAKKAGLITKQELLHQLRNEGLEISTRTLTYYMDLGLIPKGIKKVIPGITGSISFFRENVLLMIKGIKKLTELDCYKSFATDITFSYSLTLKEIVKYRNLIYKFDELALTKYLLKIDIEKTPIEDRGFIYAYYNEQHKFHRVILAYAHAEAGLSLGSFNLMVADYPTEYLTLANFPDFPIICAAIDQQKTEKIFIQIPLEDSKTIREVVYSKKGIEVNDKIFNQKHKIK